MPGYHAAPHVGNDYEATASLANQHHEHARTTLADAHDYHQTMVQTAALLRSGGLYADVADAIHHPSNPNCLANAYLDAHTRYTQMCTNHANALSNANQIHQTHDESASAKIHSATPDATV
jgi:hypothetical protein